VERTAAAIRGVMTDLRPGVLDDYGLVAALHGLGDEMAARTGIVVDVQAEELVPRLAASVENALFRIAQEALTNVMKHARASEVTVSLDAEDRVVRLVIADNGTGFELGRPQAPHDVRHWGLSAMAERALGVGGRCRVDSRPGKGTHVIVEVPR
jgi:signal transduction histidine kinase